MRKVKQRLNKKIKARLRRTKAKKSIPGFADGRAWQWTLHANTSRKGICYGSELYYAKYELYCQGGGITQFMGSQVIVDFTKRFNFKRAAQHDKTY